MRAYTMVIRIDRWPRRAAIASRLMPRLAWVASVCLSLCGLTWPIPAVCAVLATARSAAALPDALAVLGEEAGGAQAGGPCGEPGVEEVFELGVQRNVTVGAEL